MSRAAVVVNPTKRETTPQDPGRGQAESAVSAGVDLVLACGGDGTVTACAEGALAVALGGVQGSTRQLTVVAQPGALLLRMPPEAA